MRSKSKVQLVPPCRPTSLARTRARRSATSCELKSVRVDGVDEVRVRGVRGRVERVPIGRIRRVRLEALASGPLASKPPILEPNASKPLASGPLARSRHPRSRHPRNRTPRNRSPRGRHPRSRSPRAAASSTQGELYAWSITSVTGSSYFFAATQSTALSVAPSRDTSPPVDGEDLWWWSSWHRQPGRRRARRGPEVARAHRRGRPRATRGPRRIEARRRRRTRRRRGGAHAERGEAAAAGRVRRAAALDDGRRGVFSCVACSAGVLISRRSSAGPRRSVARNDERSGGGTSSLGIRRGTKRRDDSTSRALVESRVWRAFACGERGARTRAHTDARRSEIFCPSWVLRIQTILPNYLTECLLSTVHLYK